MTRSRTGSGSRESARRAPAQAVPDPSAAVNLPPRCAAVIRVRTDPHAGSRVRIRSAESVVQIRAIRVRRWSGAVTLWQVHEHERSGSRTSSRRSTPRAIGGRPTSTPVTARPDVGRTDDEEASEARRRYRSHGIEPSCRIRCIGPLLEPWRGSSWPAIGASVSIAASDRASMRADSSDAWRPVRDLGAAGLCRRARPDDRARRDRGCRARRETASCSSPAAASASPSRPTGRGSCGSRWPRPARRGPARPVAEPGRSQPAAR